MSKEKTIKQKCKLVWDSLPKGDVYYSNGEYIASCYFLFIGAYTPWGGSQTKKGAEHKLYCHNIECFIKQYCSDYSIYYIIDFNISDIVENNNLKHYDFLQYIISNLVLE